MQMQMQMKMQRLGSSRYQILRRFFYSDQGCVVKISIGFGIVKKPFLNNWYQNHVVTLTAWNKKTNFAKFSNRS